MPNSTRFSVKAVILVLSLVVGAFLAEGLARIFFPDWGPRTGGLSRFWTYDSSLGWVHIPNANGVFSAFGRATHVSINSRGFRDQERSYDREASRYRIIALGDSMVWGYGVQPDEIFTVLLERACPRSEVINLGVSGYGTDQELLLLQREGVRYNPDMVIVVVSPNDFQDNIQKKVYLVYQKPMFELSPGGLRLTNTPVPTQTLWEHAASFLVRSSFVLNRAASVYHALSLEPLARSAATAYASIEAPFPRSLHERVTVAILLEIEDVTRAAHATLLVVLTDGMEQRGREMEQFLRSRNINVLNVDYDFGQNDISRFHLRDGLHWNAAGHSKVAHRLSKYFEQQQNLSVRCRPGVS